MEETYTHMITTLAGEKQEITLNRLTVRHGLRLQGKNEDEILETLIDMVSPGVLDIISLESLEGLSDIILETEKDFFERMAKMAAKRKAKTEADKKKAETTPAPTNSEDQS